MIESNRIESNRIESNRRLGFDEFQKLVQLADVVLDPFPVGGGRSSLEIFAVATPVVMLYPRTAILQLTYSFYRTMGLVHPRCGGGYDHGSNGRGGSGNGGVSLFDYDFADDDEDVPCLVAHTFEEFVEAALALGTNRTLRTKVHRRILDRQHRLYRGSSQGDAVVDEWREFLRYIAAAPRPRPPLLLHDGEDGS